MRKFQVVAIPILLSMFQAGCATQEPDSYGFGNPEPFDGPLFTDRPSFGAGTQAVGVGRFQVEAGYTYATDGGTSVHSVPNTLLRTGLTSSSELRVSTAGAVFTEGGGSGVGDLLVGARFEVLDQDELVPNLSLQPSVSLPTGDESGSDSVNPELVVPMSWALDDRFSVLTNLGVFVQTLDATRDTEVNLATSALLGYAVTDDLSVFGEYFSNFPGAQRDQHNLDFGAILLLDDDYQIDFATGFGLNGDAPDYFVTVGLAFRF